MKCDEKVERLKMEILRTFEDLSKYLLAKKEKLLTRLSEMKEVFDKNSEIDTAIKQLRKAREDGFNVMKSNLLEPMKRKFDNRLKLLQDSKAKLMENLEYVSFRCYYDKIRKSIDEIDLIELIPEYMGKEHPVISLCKIGSGDGEFKNPRAISLDRMRNEVYICDSSNSRIQVFNTKGEFHRSFGKEHLIDPLGICVSTYNQCVFVTDRIKLCLTKFSMSGEFIKKAGCKGNGEGEFVSIKGLCCDKDLIYVCDISRQIINVFGLDLNFIQTFGHGQIRYPVDITVCMDHIIYILSQSTSDIYCYQKDFSFQKKIELRGGEQKTSVANFLQTDNRGNFLISDSSNDELRIFSPQGVLKHVIGRGHFNSISGLALDNSNNVICVCHSREKNCLQIY